MGHPGAFLGDAAAHGNYYGTTLRVYDPRIGAWRIQPTDPVPQIYLTMIGRKHGDDIVQEGRGAAGHLVRWSFSEITPQSFRWRSRVSVDEGATWRLNVEFFAHGAGPAQADVATGSCRSGGREREWRALRRL